MRVTTQGQLQGRRLRKPRWGSAGEDFTEDAKVHEVSKHLASFEKGRTLGKKALCVANGVMVDTGQGPHCRGASWHQV